ncbi:MAG: MFS transporter [Candidatus Hodarchaeota archaeon]
MRSFSTASFQISVLWGTYFLWSITQGFVGPFLNLYIYQTSQGDIFLIALITSFPAFNAILAVGFWGWAVDKFNNNRIFATLGLSSAAFLYFLGTVVTDAFQFFVLYSVLSFFTNSFVPASQSYASLQGGRSGQSFGNLFAFASIGWFSGAITSGILYDLLGMAVLFQLSCGALLFAVFLSFFGFKRGDIDGSDKGDLTPSSWRYVFLNPIIFVICVTNGFHNLFAAISGTYFSVYVTELGGASFIIGLMVALGTLLGTLLLPCFGKLTERLGRRKPFIIYTIGGLTFSAIICFLIPQPFIVSFVWAGIPFYPGMLTGAYAMLTDACKEVDRGKAVGLFNALGNLGIVIGPFIGAWIILIWDIRSSFLIVGILEFFLLLYVILFIKEPKKQKELLLETPPPVVPNLIIP